MHPTAMYNCQLFFDVYASAFTAAEPTVIDIGSQDVNGSLRACCPSRFLYCGVDFVDGKGVDVILDDPYKLPFHASSMDIVLTSSCFEHSEMFWLLYLEAMRILKPHGLLYLNVPSNGLFHRYPADCWRFYPDSGRALVTWAKRNGMNPALLESYTSEQVNGLWNDYVAVFVKDEKEAYRYTKRIHSGRDDMFNGLVAGSDEVGNFSEMPEDMRKLALIRQVVDGEVELPNEQARLDLIRQIVKDEIKVR